MVLITSFGMYIRENFMIQNKNILVLKYKGINLMAD